MDSQIPAFEIIDLVKMKTGFPIDFPISLFREWVNRKCPTQPGKKLHAEW